MADNKPSSRQAKKSGVTTRLQAAAHVKDDDVSSVVDALPSFEDAYKSFDISPSPCSSTLRKHDENSLDLLFPEDMQRQCICEPTQATQSASACPLSGLETLECGVASGRATGLQPLAAVNISSQRVSSTCPDAAEVEGDDMVRLFSSGLEPLADDTIVQNEFEPLTAVPGVPFSAGEESSLVHGLRNRIHLLETTLHMARDTIKSLSDGPGQDTQATKEKAALMERMFSAEKKATESESRLQEMQDMILTFQQQDAEMREKIGNLGTLYDQLRCVEEERDELQEKLAKTESHVHRLEGTVSSQRDEITRLRSFNGEPSDNGDKQDIFRLVDQHMDQLAQKLAASQATFQEDVQNQLVQLQVQPANAVLEKITKVLDSVSDKQLRVDDAVARLTQVPAAKGSHSHSAPAHRIPAPKFKGKSDDIDVFFELFRRFCVLNNVAATDRVEYLLMCLHEDVYKTLFDAGVTREPEWDTVIKFLRDAFGQLKQPKDWRAEFQTLRRRDGESLVVLSQRLQALARRANIPYPQDVLIDRFLDAVGKTAWSDWLQTVTSTFKVESLDAVVALAVDMENKNKFKGKKQLVVAGCKESVEDTPDWFTPSVGNLQSEQVSIDNIINVDFPKRSAVQGKTASIKAKSISSAPISTSSVSSKDSGNSIMQLLQTLIKQQQVLMTELTKKHPQRPDDGTRLNANQVAETRSVQRPTNFRRKMKCFACGSADHLVKDCDLPCAACGALGHMAVTCKSRPEKNDRRDTPTPQ